MVIQYKYRGALEMSVDIDVGGAAVSGFEQELLFTVYRRTSKILHYG